MIKKEKKKAFGYIRVSTALQVEGGYSLDDQENRIRQHAKAKANDMTLVDIYRDEGKSGKNISGRPGFQKILEAIRNGQKIDYVLVTRLSMFGRNASDVMLKSEKLKTSAKNNSEKDFEFSYFDNIDDALIEGLDQNQDFFSLLLGNDEIKREVLGIFADEIYKSLRNA